MREFLERHRKTVVSTAVTVGVLALVILVGSAFSPSKDSNQTLQTRLGQDATLQQAEAALSSGDTTTAITLANQALKESPNNTLARTIITKARSQARQTNSNGQSSNNSNDDSGSPGEQSAAADAAFQKKTKKIGAMLPASFEGYDMSYPTVVGPDADLSGIPLRAPAPAFRLAWSVHDRGSAKAATTFITKVSKVLYPKSAGSVTVDGKTAYFGTDGNELATVSYTRGRYAFEVVVVANSGDPAKLRDFAVKAAQAFPDAMPR